MKMQQSTILIKPDGIQRGLLGEIIARFERKGLKLVGIKMIRLTDPILDSWYGHHKEKPFFPRLKTYMQSAPVVAMLWEGIDAVDTVRKLCGVTLGRAAEAGSIRGDYSMSQQLNLIHASDSAENAVKEKALLFGEGEVFEWTSESDVLIYSEEERS